MEGYGLVAALLLLAGMLRAEVLTPPYFNIAENKFVEASSTCGEEVEEPELYCKLTGTNQDSIHPENLIIQGQVCDWCNKSNDNQRHPAKYAVDGSENFWMSPPLSRGVDYNQVNFTINLGQEFHVSYVLIKMGNSPRPGVWVLERSADNGETWKPWQYFADTEMDCEAFFGRESLPPITSDDSVICETSYSKIVPLQGGEIVISLIKNRPSATSFFESSVLQEFTRATNVRLRFIRAKTLLGHLMSIAREDPSVMRRYFYSIKDISIGGRCRCNGHADECDETHPTNPYKLLCRCKHNTTGHNCERCQDNMVQKAWQQSKPGKLFVCEACNCHGHTDRCIYNETVDELKLSLDIYGKYEGGGVCQDCGDNTEGINCEKCRPGYFRPFHKSQNESDACHRCDCDDIFFNGECAVGSGKCFCNERYAAPDCDSCAHGYFGYPDCKPCVCNLNGTTGGYCEPVEGTCPCKENFAGFDCKECSLGYFNFPFCSRCQCNPIGSLNDECNAVTGECECNANFGSDKCTECADGYFDFPTCGYCSCDARGSTKEICSKEDGKCFCKEGYGGERCDQCLPGYYGFPDCQPCNCSDTGSSSIACDVTGKCPCLSSYGGQRCNKCLPGYYDYPKCLPCHCNSYGSEGISCDDSGKCTCNHLFTGLKCEKCEEGRFNFPICEECSCHPAGIVENFPGCGNLSTIGQLCQCKPRVQGRTCDQCRPLYWNLAMSNPHGCQECDCYEAGVLGGISECNTQSGQCVCKPFTKSRRCDTCIDGMFNLEANNLFGCAECGCDVGGAENEACDKVTGQCRCRPRIAGRTCSEPLKAHYYPTLYQFQYEAENGTTPDRKNVRFGSSESIFPGYSWKGYVVFSKIQSDLIHEVEVLTQTIYHMILRYINPNDDNVKVDVSVSQQDGDQLAQIFEVILKPTVNNEPQFVVLPAKGSPIPAPLVMDPGQWNIHIHNDRPLFLDYFVLLPAAYYEGNILVDRVVTPCNVSDSTFCKHFRYPSAASLDHALTKHGFVFEHGSRQPLLEYLPESHLDKLGMGKGSSVSDKIAVLSDIQPEMSVELSTKQQGSHVLIISYLTEGTNQQPLDVKVQARVAIDKTQDGKATLPSCPYTWLCRQVVLDSEGRVAHFNFSNNVISITLQANNNAPTGIESIIAVPTDDWSVNYITPKPVCVIKEGQCMETNFFTPLDFKKIEFESESKLSVLTPPDAFDKTAGYVYLDEEDRDQTIKGRVTQPGEYVFVIHYYQPDYPDYIMDAVMEENNQSTKASVIIGHCPSNSGCRTTLNNNKDGTQYFDINSNFTLNFKQPPHSSVWLDYLLIVPAAKYNDRLIEEEPIVKSSQFLSECGQNFFHMDKNTSEFCKKSVFSVTTAYNEGALPCKCRPEGSQSLNCDQFGGQCDCKPNIIGRRCEECKPGYFGYPDCRRCDCPALCDDYTGECMCPPRVVGPNCDRCDNYTFGYHAVVGCEPCDCNPLGVANNDLQCDLYEGICTCKTNVEGRKCDQCSAGYFGFPDCDQCECDLRGTTDEICDQDSAYCICKKNVDGSACDVCKDGTFNIQDKNPEGCTKCFCFGKTTQCSSSRLYRTLITGMNDWGISLVNMSKNALAIEEVNEFAPSVEGTTEAVGVDLTKESFDKKVVYLTAPKQYLGNQLTAYGGYLRYSLFCTTAPSGSSVDDYPDVILQGGNPLISLIHFSVEVPSVAEYFNATVEISEGNFILPSGLSVKRDKLMQVLQDLKTIYIKATYWANGVTTRLTGVSLDSAKETPSGLAQAAMSVEQCNCPPSYTGLSCEECAAGYYRAPTGPFGGYCIPCQCNNHAQDCDKVTGKCIDCQHNTEGDHCEKCARGYHGNATIGYPYDCLICACPLPMPSNNFADSCDMSEDNEEISCDCQPGYTGYRCQSCANGFYGRPEEIGDYCKPCNCSGNLDTDADISCDSVTGECKSCLNNAFGVACELCKPWFYGDAVSLKNCQGCDCNECGSMQCNHTTGNCDCKKNVIGEKCDRCELNHFGFNTCEGCQPCLCDVASNSKQCEPFSGQCSCKPGVAGRNCSKCAPGHWNYTEEGCTKCECKELYSENVDCDAETGQCTCLPGVLGATCDHCPELTVLDPVLGCLPCDTCVHTLVNDTKLLSLTLEPYIKDFSSMNSTFYLNQRLNYIDEEVFSLVGSVKMLENMRLDLGPLEKEIDLLKGNTFTLDRKVQFEFEKAEGANDDKLVNDVNDLENLVSESVVYAKNVVREVAEIADNFQTGRGKYGVKQEEFEEAIAEAKQILEDLENNKLQYNLNDVKENQLVRAQKCLDDIMKVKEKRDMQSSKIKMLDDNLENLSSKIMDLNNHILSVQEQIDKTNKLNEDNRNANVGAKFKELNEKEEISNQTLSQAEEFNINTTLLLSNATALKEKLNKIRGNLEELSKGAKEGLSKYDNLTDLWNVVENAREKAEQMTRDVELDKVEAGSYNNSAISAYKDIIQTIRDALMAANDSVVSTEQAEQLIEGIDAKVADLSSKANEQYNEGRTIVLALDDLDKELSKQIEHVGNLEKSNEMIKEDLNDIESRLEKTNVDMGTPDLSIDDSTNDVARGIMDKINEIVTDLPAKLSESIQLDKERKDIKNNYELAQKQVEQAMSVTDNKELKNLAEDLKERSDKINERSSEVNLDLDKLKKQIQSLREKINSIDIPSKFHHNSTLEPRKPEMMPLDEINNYVSMFFKTTESNGLLFFLGNEKGLNKRSRRSMPTDEFIALEIESGYAKLTVDLGVGPTSIINPRIVNDGIWYRAIIDRIGKIIKLKIIWEEKDVGKDSRIMQRDAEGMLTGNATILNLDKTRSKLFVGGYPLSFRAPDAVTYNSFDGTVQDVTLGDQKIGLWNFVDQVNVQPDYARDTLENTTTTTGFRFNGEGYIVLPTTDLRLRERSSISLQFKTFIEEGLIFLAAKENNFMSIELRRGQVLFQFDLGEGPKILATNREKGYNTGTWHTIEAARDGRNGILKVDGQKIGQGEAPGSNKNLRVEHIYIGGYPNGHKIQTVSMRSFDGCIDHVQISGTAVDLNKNSKSYGVVPGCPEKIAKVIWFEKGTRGYAGMPASLDDSQMELVLRFKTDVEDGTLVYLTDGANPTTIKLIKGQVVFSSGGQTVSTNAPHGYSDAQWHVVMATHSNTAIILFIDDYQSYTSEGAPRPIRLLSGSGRLFLGGVPSDIDATAALEPHFAGCLGQLTLNGQLINLGNMTDVSRDVVIGKCLSLKDTHKVVLPPPLELPSGIPLIPDDDNDEDKTMSPMMTTTPAPKLKYDSECKLPLYPESVHQKPKQVGYRFGTKIGSRLEYGLMKYNKQQFVISFEMSTRGEEGLILYASDIKFFDFFAVYLKEKKLYFKIKCGSEEKNLNSHEMPHDEWQVITIVRQKSEVILKINNVQVDEAAFRCDALNIVKPIYLGGINPDIFEKATISSLKDVDMTFSGCLKHFKIGDNLMGEPSAKYGVIPCAVNYEPGVFFSPDGGYIKHVEKYNVGTKMNIEMEIKPRSRSGVLLSVHTPRRDYIVLELVDGSVRIAVDNGLGEISSTFVPPDPHFFCDGNWHKIKALKIKNVVTLAVDNKQAENGVGDKRQLTTDTRHILFLGGKPRGITRGIKSTTQFVGCMRSVKINDEMQDINVLNAVGNVTVGVCPTT